MTFSTANPVQDLQDASQHSYYDSGLEESETPSSKSSSGPRIGPLTLPEDHYERTTPDGSIGETEHPENGMISAAPSNLSCEAHEYVFKWKLAPTGSLCVSVLSPGDGEALFALRCRVTPGTAAAIGPFFFRLAAQDLIGF